MNELADGVEFLVAGDLLFQEILDGLDVMISGAFDVLDPLRVLLAEIFDDIVQDMLRMVTASFGLRYEDLDKAQLLKSLESFLLARSPGSMPCS